MPGVLHKGEVTVCCATFGDLIWRELAYARALPSAASQGVTAFHVHGETLQDARNAGLARCPTSFICYLDADDVLEPGFFDAMNAAPDADLRAPAVRYTEITDVYRGSSGPARMPNVWGHSHQCTAECLEWGNWLVIGTVAPTQMLRDVGGWRDFSWSEDYDMWVRCWKAGASIVAVPDAIYRAYVRRDSRNRAPVAEARMEAHRAIAAANGLPVPG